MLGVEKTLVDEVEFDDEHDVLVVFVRPKARERNRCGRCRRRCARYDRGSGPRRWRALDLGTVQAFVFGIQPHDARAFAIAGITLLAAALVASAVPARRAASVDPTVALRAE